MSRTTSVRWVSRVALTVITGTLLLPVIRGEETAARNRATGSPQESGFWPQWRGPNRDNVSTENGLLKTWPEGGPPLVRVVKGIGEGIGSVAVAGRRVYLLGYIADSEYVTALNEVTGHRVWVARIGPAVAEAATMRWLSQRTPTVDGKRLYAFTSHGELICLDTADGSELWRKSYIRDFGAKTHPWGLCDYPLVDGDRLICAPGGSDATVVAMNKTNGDVIWQSKFDAADDWSGINVCEVGGIRQYVMYLGKNLCGVAADDGRLLWRNEEVAMPRNYNTPIIHNDLVFCGTATGSGRGGVGLLQLSADGKAVKATQEYFHWRIPPSSFSDSAVLRDGHVYLLCGRGDPTCLEMKTGSVIWRQRIRDRSRGDGWVFADAHLYLRQTSGHVILVEATPRGYIEKGSFVIPEHTPSRGATIPVISGGHLYLRDNDRLLWYDVREERSKTGKTLPATINLPSPAPVATDRPQQPRSVFVPTPLDVVKKMLELAKVRQSDVVYDLGSGDGRIVIAAAKQYGCRAIGYEIDAELVGLSRNSAEKAGLGKLVTIQHKDVLSADLSNANVVALYLIPRQLETLLPQLKKLKPGARIVSHEFEIPGIKPNTTTEVDSAEDGAAHKIHLWTAPLAESR